MDQFDGHFDALSAAATRSTVVMEAPDTETTTQYDQILATMAELKMISIAALETTGDGNRDSATGRLTPDERTKSNIHINQLMSAIKGKWVPGGFCSTHGHDVGPGHSSKNCNNKIRGGETGRHNNNATRAHNYGPGKTRTKIGINVCCDRRGPLMIV